MKHLILLFCLVAISIKGFTQKVVTDYPVATGPVIDCPDMPEGSYRTALHHRCLPLIIPKMK
jgi:hypothetical protein